MFGMVGGFIAKTGVSVSLPADRWASSGFFGALFAGFIAGYMALGLRRLFDRIPRALEGTKPVLLYPLTGILGTGVIMVFLVNPPMSVFNAWLDGFLVSMGSGSRVVFGLILGGMMSVDFGGPINKAAYVFGTASIASGNNDIMAAVMIGGMTPPVSLALAALFFRDRFTAAERQTAVTNIIMGCSFITEGAIPLAASDPLRVIPACAIGAAMAGGLSMLFRCGSPAPHGGIFVVGIIEHPLLFLLAFVTGSVVGALFLRLLKKSLLNGIPKGPGPFGGV
jgi:PTS system fructose-specific IIC component